MKSEKEEKRKKKFVDSFKAPILYSPPTLPLTFILSCEFREPQNPPLLPLFVPVSHLHLRLSPPGLEISPSLTSPCTSWSSFTLAVFMRPFLPSSDYPPNNLSTLKRSPHFSLLSRAMNRVRAVVCHVHPSRLSC